MKVLLDFLGRILGRLAIPFWMTTVHVVVPWKWGIVTRVSKSFLINIVISSVEGGTIKDKESGARRPMTGVEKQQAVYATLSSLIYIGAVESEEALRSAIDGGVVQLNSLKVLN